MKCHQREADVLCPLIDQRWDGHRISDVAVREATVVAELLSETTNMVTQHPSAGCQSLCDPTSPRVISAKITAFHCLRCEGSEAEIVWPMESQVLAPLMLDGHICGEHTSYRLMQSHHKFM